MDGHWTELPGGPEVEPGQMRCVQAAGRSLVLCNVAGELHCVLNECPDAGLPLDDGELRGPVLTCSYHGYAYNVKNGRNIDFPHEEPPARVYPVRERDGVLEVQLPVDAAASSEEDGDHD
jgi:nitrite reductase/ring-hydroxylating ferredoxin subunit